MKTVLTVCAGLLIFTATAFGEDSTKTEMVPDSAKAEAAAEPVKEAKKMEFVTTESGLKYADLVVGEGKEAAKGMMVECHYTLWFADDKGEKGEKVQSSKDMDRTFEFEVGNPGLIKGWNEGMLGMKEGGTRMLIVPSELGYGSAPPPGIPKDQMLIFELEFIKAK